ncbi:lipopolysaccharide assembly protein LapB [Thalassobacillus sp. CUG 92003]|uniref:tetratricopeptide repeat protein n=1 Tax=Thalassobacillus sp. CUG 92003 TaxID=2736641 RepID=UPI0015E68339|nr:hypothetical protein [Thalassobacillus sp. CUG 92003]
MTSEHVPSQTDKDNVIPFVPDGEFYFTYGVQSFQKRKFEASIKWLKKAIEVAPDEPLYPCQLSVVYTEVGSYHAANQLLTGVISEFGKQYVDCYYLMANNYAHLGLLDDAKKYAETYLEVEENGEFKEAADQLLEMLDSIEEEEPEDDEWKFEEEDELLVYQETVFYHIEHKEWEKAVIVLEEMMQLYPEFTVAKHNYAYALFQLGQRNEAIELEEQWLQQNHEDIHSHINLALFYSVIDSPDRARVHIQNLLNVYPILNQQRFAIAEVLTKTGYYSEAVARFRKLKNTHLQRRRGYFKWYSIAVYHTGNPSKALGLWEEGCRRHPELSEEGGPWNKGEE